MPRQVVILIETEQFGWSKQYDMYLKKDEKYKEQKAKVFSLIT